MKNIAIITAAIALASLTGCTSFVAGCHITNNVSITATGPVPSFK